ncbi:MAG: hypothetical protein EOP04_10205 [Proteobacteria bacterium]|nr:MAG: hypothetical protein EOP04_10205 [Pseudomonadota bacterium]
MATVAFVLSKEDQEIACQLWDGFSQANTPSEAIVVRNSFMAAPNEVRLAILQVHGEIWSRGRMPRFAKNPFERVL